MSSTPPGTTVGNLLVKTPLWNKIVSGIIVVVGSVIAAVSYGMLIPLDSVQSSSAVIIIICVSYAISVILWIIVMLLYSKNHEQLTLLNTHMLLLIALPATVGATAMNVASIHNMRNVISSQII